MFNLHNKLIGCVPMVYHATGAAIGSAVVGGAGLIQGKRESDKSEKNFSKASATLEKYMAQANVRGEESLEFSKGMLADWEETFGSIEDNLSDYYENLDPAKYASQYKSNLNDNIDKELGQMNDTFAASGLQTAGMKQQTAKEAAFAKATGGAQADLAADDKVNSMKQGFLNSGSGQRNAANSANLNSYNNLANISSNTGTALSGMYTSLGNRQAQDAGGFMKGGLNALSGGVGAYAGTDSGKAIEKKLFG